MGGLKWLLGTRRNLEDRRGEVAVRDVADATDGGRVSFQPPAGLGPFSFPAPYGTQGIRLTNASNAPDGCAPRLYSYHSVINNHGTHDHLYVIVGRRSGRPLLFVVLKATGQIVSTREISLDLGEAEGVYFSDRAWSMLYFLEGPRLQRFDVFEDRVSTVFTLQSKYGDDLWQAHSSSDDQIHSATVRRRTPEGTYPTLGCVVDRAGHQLFFPSTDLDECQIDKSGRWLIIQEHHDNRIVDTVQGGERTITNQQGALAHLDVGDGIMVGEDDSSDRWQMTRWDLPTMTKTVLMRGPRDWHSGMGHLAVRGNTVLLSSNTTTDLHVIPADGSGPNGIMPGPHIIADGMMDGSDYDHQLRACLDPVGEFACWIAKVDGRFDAFLVRLPGASAPPIIVTPPTPGGTVSPLETLKQLRKGYPTPMSSDQLGQLLNAVAWAHRAEGYGVLAKPTGGNCRQPQTGILISRDILALPDGRIFDALIDAEGKAEPTWGAKKPVNKDRWRAPVDPAGDVDPPKPPDQPKPPTGGGTMKPYDDAMAVEFGQAVNQLYEGTGRTVDAGMIAVQAMRAWHDYQSGMSWPASRDKHVAEFKQAAGL